MLKPLLLTVLLALIVQPVQAAEAPSASDASVTPAQAQQALEVLQDEKKRAALIETLQTIAKAAPPASAPASTSTLSLKPTGLGAQLLVQLSDWVTQTLRRVCRNRQGGDRFPDPVALAGARAD